MWMVRRNVRCTRRGAVQYLYLWLVLGAVLPFSSASAGDWPLGYVLDEGSRSPDGHYGITIPRHDHNMTAKLISRCPTISRSRITSKT